MISTRSVGLLIDTVVCLTLAKWETVSGRFGGYLTPPTPPHKGEGSRPSGLPCCASNRTEHALERNKIRLNRHARAWRGHPRLLYSKIKDVDGRNKSGHDAQCVGPTSIRFKVKRDGIDPEASRSHLVSYFRGALQVISPCIFRFFCKHEKPAARGRARNSNCNESLGSCLSRRVHSRAVHPCFPVKNSGNNRSGSTTF